MGLEAHHATKANKATKITIFAFLIKMILHGPIVVATQVVGNGHTSTLANCLSSNITRYALVRKGRGAGSDS